MDKKAYNENSPSVSSSASSIKSDAEAAPAQAVDLLAERPDQGSNLTAFANIVCVVAGTGTLGLPYALAQGGWIGVGILFMSMIMSIYTGILIMKCIYYNGHTRLHSYQEIGLHAFGRPGLWAVWFFHTSIVLGAPVMYFILSGSQIYDMTKSSVNLSETAWIWICAGVVSVPFVVLKTLKEVSLLSIFGALATVVLCVVTMVESIVQYPEFKDVVGHDAVILKNLPMAVATISVCFGGNVVYMHVEESMRYPRSWNKVLVWALLACVVMYAVVAIPGYLTYGNTAQSPILLSLPDNVWNTIASIFIIIHVLLAAPILMTSFALEIERVFKIDVDTRGVAKERLLRTVNRLIILGVVGGIASLVPYFDSFMSLLGALGNCSLIFILPIVFYWRLIGWRHMPWYELAFCAFTLIIGALSAVIGTIDAIKALNRDFTQGR
ncbi:hypothetical protein DFQ27_007708 [Actinomortierella ambigua]|uniref:Amino acid transporter transmembrane domain-containing protein n=1 Tax=Actinomortierella ambigua TaxID=1343610 RepID=A0A9P6PUJ4_9FUNG|nr:hypothetical protein DFQ27_007708 [Actinomortierella ambigua]